MLRELLLKLGGRIHGGRTSGSFDGADERCRTHNRRFASANTNGKIGSVTKLREQIDRNWCVVADFQAARTMNRRRLELIPRDGVGE